MSEYLSGSMLNLLNCFNYTKEQKKVVLSLKELKPFNFYFLKKLFSRSIPSYLELDLYYSPIKGIHHSVDVSTLKSVLKREVGDIRVMFEFPEYDVINYVIRKYEYVKPPHLSNKHMLFQYLYDVASPSIVFDSMKLESHHRVMMSSLKITLKKLACGNHFTYALKRVHVISNPKLSEILCAVRDQVRYSLISSLVPLSTCNFIYTPEGVQFDALYQDRHLIKQCIDKFCDMYGFTSETIKLDIK